MKPVEKDPGNEQGRSSSRPCRFTKKQRLNRASEFEAVKRAGRTHHGPLFALSCLRCPAGTGTRFGIITSRRMGGAVIRNRARRLLREIIRESLPSVAQNHWIVLIARRGMASASLKAVREEWLRLARRASIFPKEKPTETDTDESLTH